MIERGFEALNQPEEKLLKVKLVHTKRKQNDFFFV